jgi:NAD(P)-dependent dehydrogenase (short-subunit alcohol dehydrogenase family)
MSLTFDNDVVVVTGAGRGLGRSHALLMASLGARVVVNDIGGATDGTGTDEGAAAGVVREIEAGGGTAVADTHNGSTIDGARAIVGTALDAFGRIDALVANAGILRDAAFHKVSDEDFFAVIDVHLVGTVRVCHAAYPLMREQGYGRIVTTTSGAGLFGNFGQTSYAAAKMGIAGFTRSLALEGAKKGVLVNAIAPGASTRMTESLGLEGAADKLRPELVSPLVAYLCHRSNQAAGNFFSVGGSRFARVKVGVTPGIIAEDPTIDSVADDLDQILAEEELVFPQNVFEDVAMMLDGHR